MTTEAKKTFDVNIQRATYFLDIHEQTQPGGVAVGGAAAGVVSAGGASWGKYSYSPRSDRRKADSPGGPLRDAADR